MVLFKEDLGSLDCNYCNRNPHGHIQRKISIPCALEYVTGGKSMPIIMILYYVITAYFLGMLLWNFIKEKKNVEDMLLYLLVMIPLVLRILHVK